MYALGQRENGFINKIFTRVFHSVLTYVLRLYKYFNYKSHTFGSMWFLNVIVRCADRLWGGGWGTPDFPPPPPSSPTLTPDHQNFNILLYTYSLFTSSTGGGGGDRVTTRCFHLFLSLDFLLFCFKSPSPCALAFSSFDVLEGSNLGRASMVTLFRIIHMIKWPQPPPTYKPFNWTPFPRIITKIRNCLQGYIGQVKCKNSLAIQMYIELI